MDVLNAVEDFADDTQAAAGSAGQIHLGHIPGNNDLGTETEPGEEHLHLLTGGVLRLVQDDESVVQGPAAHVRERRDLDGSALDQSWDRVRIDHVVQGVVERSQIRVDLVVKRAG